MPRIYFTLYWAGATLLVATLLMIGIMVGRVDAMVLPDDFPLTFNVTEPQILDIGLSFDRVGIRTAGPTFIIGYAWLFDSSNNSIPMAYADEGFAPFGDGAFGIAGRYGSHDAIFGLDTPGAYSLNFGGFLEAQCGEFPGECAIENLRLTANIAPVLVASAVPEPATWFMLMLGFISLFRLKKFLGQSNA